MKQHPWTLRSIFVTVVLLVTALSLLVSSALVVLTTTLKRATESIGSAVESVRIAEEAEISIPILLYNAPEFATGVAIDVAMNLLRDGVVHGVSDSSGDCPC